MKQKEILGLFKRTGAYLKGHFLLSSGLHSAEYLQCALLLQYPAYAQKLCRELASHFKKEKPASIVAPALGGIIVSYEVARALSARFLFTERVDGKMALRRAFEIKPKEKVLIVEDVITTGLSTKEVIGVVKSKKANIIGVGSLVDRSTREIDFGVKLVSLLKLDIPAYLPQDCPLCKKGIGVTKLGSRG